MQAEIDRMERDLDVARRQITACVKDRAQLEATCDELSAKLRERDRGQQRVFDALRREIGHMQQIGRV